MIFRHFWCGPPRKRLRQSHRGSPVALPGLSTLMGCWEVTVIPLHSLDTAMYAIQAYLLPCNHRKTCRETKWMNSKQISLSIEAPLNSGTSCMVRDGKWATTHGSTLFGQEVGPYFPPGSTLVWHWLFSHFWCQNNKKYIPILRNILVTHECPDLLNSWSRVTFIAAFKWRKLCVVTTNACTSSSCLLSCWLFWMSFNYLMGQNRDNKHALRGKKLPLLLANSALIDWGLQSHSAVTYWNCTASNWGCERQSTISSQFPRILYNWEQKSVYLAQGESSRWVF